MQSDVVRVELASGALEVVSGSKVPVVRVAVDQGGTSSVALPEVHIGTGAPTGDEVLWVDTDESGTAPVSSPPEVHVGTDAPTGDEVLWVDTDAPGTAYEQAGAVAAHEAAENPHPQYATDADLAGKAPTSHTHSTSEVTGLDSVLAGKAPTSHTHTLSDLPPTLATTTYVDNAVTAGGGGGGATSFSSSEPDAGVYGFWAVV